MMYSELSNSQQSICSNVMAASLVAAMENDRVISSFGIKMLLVANSAALLLLINFLGAIDPNKQHWLPLLSLSVLGYLLGLIFAARQYLLIMTICGQTIPHTYNQILGVMKNEIAIDDVKSYGFNEEGNKLFSTLGSRSSLSFVLSTVACIIYIFRNFW